MAKYVLDLSKAHAESMIELINNDNTATIVEPLTLAGYNLINPRAVVPGDGLTSPRTHAVTVQNKKVTADTVEVFYNKINLREIVNMTSESGDYDWYTPETWDDSTSPAQAIAAFKKACVRQGVTPDAVLGTDITVTRAMNQTTNHWELTFAFTSLVMLTNAVFQMPKHFSENVTVTDLVGFTYQPIAPENVVE